MKKTLHYVLAALALLTISTQGLYAQWYEITEDKYDSEGKMLYCNYNYKSVDEKGEEITLSAYLQCGSSANIKTGTATDQLKEIVMMHHVTIYDNSGCPSQQKYDLTDLSVLLDKLIIAPDYEGFGTSKDHQQMYLIHDLMGRQCYDALEAGKKLFDEKSNLTLSENWRLFLAGASQGAANAVATHRYMSQHNYCDDWRLASSVVCDGPYCPGLFFQTILDDENFGKLYLPFTVVLSLKAMMAAYPADFAGIEEKEFYTDEFAAYLPQIDAAIATRDKSLDDLENQLTSDKKVPYDVHNLFSADLFDQNSEKRTLLINALNKCDLTKDWTPSQSIVGWAYEYDDVVPNVNSVALKEALGDKVEFDNPVDIIAMAQSMINMPTYHQIACGGFLMVASMLHVIGMDIKGVDDYINEMPTGIENIYAGNAETQRYDLQGRTVGQNHRGMTVVGGKLQFIR